MSTPPKPRSRAAKAAYRRAAKHAEMISTQQKERNATMAKANRTANPTDIRIWAVANGFPHLEGQRGRLSSDAIEAFYKAHSPSGKPKKLANA